MRIQHFERCRLLLICNTAPLRQIPGFLDVGTPRTPAAANPPSPPHLAFRSPPASNSSISFQTLRARCHLHRLSLRAVAASSLFRLPTLLATTLMTTVRHHDVAACILERPCVAPSGQLHSAPLLMISLQQEVRRPFISSAWSRLHILPRLQALHEHLNQFGVDFFNFVWDESVEVSAAVHVYTPAPDDSSGDAQLGSIAHPSLSQRVPWSPLALELVLERGATYLSAAPPCVCL